MRLKAPWVYLFAFAVHLIIFLTIGVTAFAQQPHFDNDSLIPQPVTPEQQPAIGQPSPSLAPPETLLQQSQQQILTLLQKRGKYAEPPSIEEELLNNPALTEHLINANLLSQNWDALDQLLPIYAQINSHDPILLSYAKGALYRQQNKHTLAIKEYRNILAAQPDLIYVRFDLAAMLFENKEYTAARDQFYKIKAAENLPQDFYFLTDQYLEAIQKQEGWDWNIGLEYTHNDNVNNASSIEEIQIGPFIFLKNEDALPQSANGIGYQFGTQRNIPIQDNHYLAVNAQFYGIDYWDNKDYSEQTLRVGTGYKYQDIRVEYALIPSIERTWLGQKEYALNIGINAETKYWLNHQNQLIASYHYIDKSYDDTQLEGYEGNLQRLSLSLIHFYSPTLIFIGGVETQWDTLNEKDESSEKYGLQAGVIKEWRNSLSTRINFRYAHRRFNEEHFLMPHTRQDHEYQVDLALWHRKIHWRGITPKLNYRYVKIDSNIPEFYSRDSKQFFLSLEKTF